MQIDISVLNYLQELLFFKIKVILAEIEIQETRSLIECGI